jgi:hypothetical protein
MITASTPVHSVRTEMNQPVTIKKNLGSHKKDIKMMHYYRHTNTRAHFCINAVTPNLVTHCDPCVFAAITDSKISSRVSIEIA